MKASPRRSGGDGQFVAGFLAASVLAVVTMTLIRLGRGVSTTDLYAWATATRTATYTYVDVAFNLLVVSIIVIAPQIMRGGFSSG